MRTRARRRQEARDTVRATRRSGRRAFQMALLEEPLAEDDSHDLIVDLFAGCGGASEGIRQALGRDPDVAVNHWEHAIKVHKLNHRGTHHFCTDVWDLKTRQNLPRGRIRLLWASPDCRHHSRAKGGKPVSEKIRGLAWVVTRVAKERLPDFICVENVPEFKEWRPLGPDQKPIKKTNADGEGETFLRWVGELQALGYVVEWRLLTAADYGAPTSRKRLFILARRDGRPIEWPEPTHGPGRPHPHRTAAECIDWSIPMRSIFDRKKPLVDATLARIAACVRRFLLECANPYLLRVGEDGALVLPGLVQTGFGEREGQAPRALDILKPLGTVVAGGAKHGLIAAFLQKHNRGAIGQPLDVPMSTLVGTNNKSLVAVSLTTYHGAVEGRVRAGGAVDAPLATVDTSNRFGLVASFLTRYFGSEKSGQALTAPLSTITTKDRHALVCVAIDGETYVLTDILFRMLTPRELARAQGFSDDYQITGTATQQIKLIGNSVCPPLARAIVEKNVVPLFPKRRPGRRYQEAA